MGARRVSMPAAGFGQAGIGLAIVAYVTSAFRRLVRRFGAGPADTPPPSPPRLRHDADTAKVRRAINRYLKSTGWRLAEPWTWANVTIRASKNDRSLNMLLMDNEFATWMISIMDVQALSIEMNEIIGIIANSEPPPDAKALAEETGVFVMALKDLADVDGILNDAQERKDTKSQRVSDANTTKSYSPKPGNS